MSDYLTRDQLEQDLKDQQDRLSVLEADQLSIRWKVERAQALIEYIEEKLNDLGDSDDEPETG